MVEMYQNSSSAGGQYMPGNSSDGQKNYVNFFVMAGVHGNISLNGKDPREIYGALQKLNLIRNGKHDFDPDKLQSLAKSVRPEDDPNDEEHHIPLPPPLDAKCAFCKTEGDAEKVRKISALKLEICKCCLRMHWKADFEKYWEDNKP